MRGVEFVMFYLKLGTTAGTLEKIASICGLAIGFLFGGWSQLLTTLLVIQVLDIFTGLLVGFRNKNISSLRMREGFTTKVGYWILLILAHLIDQVLLQGQMVTQTAVLFGFIAVESLSITENLGMLGVIVPQFITKYLEQVRGKGDIYEVQIGKVPQNKSEESRKV